jgi:hypothetical protein
LHLVQRKVSTSSGTMVTRITPVKVGFVKIGTALCKKSLQNSTLRYRLYDIK